MRPVSRSSAPGGLIPSYNNSLGLRTVDGTYNNLLNPTWGAADQQFTELLTPEFRPRYNPSNDPNSVVIDSSIRTISNLIVDQTLGNPAAILTAPTAGRNRRPGKPDGRHDPNQQCIRTDESLFSALTAAEVAAAEAAAAAAANPDDPDLAAAAVAAEAARAGAETALTDARSALDTLLATNGVELDGANVVLSNVAPDEGLSAPFNSWFTLFGQFFDHGLDLVNKGGSGTVFIPLQPDDPLYVAGSPTNFMVLTRATVSAGRRQCDGHRRRRATRQHDDVVRRPEPDLYLALLAPGVLACSTTLDADGVPLATGKLIEGANGGMATWAEVKAQARICSASSSSTSTSAVFRCSRPISMAISFPDADGYAQVITGIGVDRIPLERRYRSFRHCRARHIRPVVALRTGHAFLADIAHNAVPIGKIADGDITIGLGNPGNGDTGIRQRTARCAFHCR